jgi:hypothetical protein
MGRGYPTIGKFDADIPACRREELVHALAHGEQNAATPEESGEIDNTALWQAIEAISDSVPDERWTKVPEGCIVEPRRVPTPQTAAKIASAPSRLQNSR